jgi:hypothetical protein
MQYLPPKRRSLVSRLGFDGDNQHQTAEVFFGVFGLLSLRAQAAVHLPRHVATSHGTNQRQGIRTPTFFEHGTFAMAGAERGRQ